MQHQNGIYKATVLDSHYYAMVCVKVYRPTDRHSKLLLVAFAMQDFYWGYRSISYVNHDCYIPCAQTEVYQIEKSEQSTMLPISNEYPSLLEQTHTSKTQTELGYVRQLRLAKATRFFIL